MLNESMDKVRNELILAVVSNFKSITESEKRDILSTGIYSYRLYLLAIIIQGPIKQGSIS